MIEEPSIEDFGEPSKHPHSTRAKPSAAVSVPDHEGVKVVRSVIIQKPLEEIFRTLNFQDLTGYLFPVESVSRVGRRFRWLLKPKGMSHRPVAWLAEVIRDRPKKMFAWRTVDPSDIASAGSIWLRDLPNDRGTEIRIILKYDIPNEFFKVEFENLFGGTPEKLINDGLRRFKSVIETGEVATIEGQPRGMIQ